MGVLTVVSPLWVWLAPSPTQVAQTARLFATGGVETLVSFALDATPAPGGFPRYTPVAATHRKFATPAVPLYVLVGTLDPQTPHGLGAWYARGLGPKATLVTVPYAAHGTTNPDDPCVLNMVADFLLAFGEAPMNTTCVAREPAPDFGGAHTGTKQVALQAFGVTDLWNSGE